jgi:PncC family amidohydrolase
VTAVAMSSRTVASDLYRELKERGWTVSVAESCTGGLVAAAITAVPGASAVFREAYVVYSDEAKAEILGVDRTILTTKGSVSEECAGEMARNLEKLAKCDIALSVTGYAGPTGGTDADPLGTVWFGIAVKGRLTTFGERFSGNRGAVRRKACGRLLEKALDVLRAA